MSQPFVDPLSTGITNDADLRSNVYIYDKGGLQRLLSLDPLTQVTWGRVQDDISSARVIMTNPSAECIAGLERIRPMRHELVITQGGRRVWEGPITLYKERPDRIEISARDVLFYTNRAAIRRVYKSANGFGGSEPVPTRLESIIKGEMARFENTVAPVNVVSHVHTILDDNTVRTTRSNLPYERYVWEEMDEMAWRNGVDYTTAAREIYIHDTDTPLGQLRQFTEDDFLSPAELGIYGVELATTAIVTDRMGRHAEAGLENGTDDYYGRVELLHGTYYDSPGEEADDQTHVPIEEMRTQARRDFAPRYPLPMVVRVPENSTLNLDTYRELGHALIPGVRIPVTITTPVRTASMLMKLRSVKVTEDSSGVRVEVTLVPAPEAGAVEAESGE